jgi:hypothetical protein
MNIYYIVFQWYIVGYLFALLRIFKIVVDDDNDSVLLEDFLIMMLLSLGSWIIWICFIFYSISKSSILKTRMDLTFDDVRKQINKGWD